MIKFSCKKCGHLISVNEKYSGKKGKCPKCGNIIIIPGKSTIIEFTCETCGHKIKVPDSYAGKKGKCPKCKNPIVVPSPEKTQAESFGSASVTCSICGETVKNPVGSTQEFIECPGCGSYIETSSDRIPTTATESDASSPTATEDDQYEEDSEESEESGGMDRRIIIIISSAAAVLVLGLIILIAILRPSRPQQEIADTGESLSQIQFDGAQKFIERYIDLLESGDVNEAYELHSPDFTGPAVKSWIDTFYQQIGTNRIVAKDCQQTNREPHPEGDQILLWYHLRYERGSQRIIFSVIEIEEELILGGIAVLRGSVYHILAGPNALDALRDVTTATTIANRNRLSSFFCGFAIVILLFALLQVVSMWIVFEKEGYPGWASIIPFYNMWVLAKVGDKPGWMGLLMCFTDFIPYIGVLIGFCLWIVISLGVAKTFGRTVLFGIGLSFLPAIFYPILAFSRS